jgi:hypothetical protein
MPYVIIFILLETGNKFDQYDKYLELGKQRHEK